MKIGVNDKKIALFFENVQEAIEELAKLSKSTEHYLKVDNKVLKLSNIGDFIANVIIECEYEIVKEVE